MSGMMQPRAGQKGAMAAPQKKSPANNTANGMASFGLSNSFDVNYLDKNAPSILYDLIGTIIYQLSALVTR